MQFLKSISKRLLSFFTRFAEAQDHEIEMHGGKFNIENGIKVGDEVHTMKTTLGKAMAHYINTGDIGILASILEKEVLKELSHERVHSTPGGKSFVRKRMQPDDAQLITEEIAEKWMTHKKKEEILEKLKSHYIAGLKKGGEKAANGAFHTYVSFNAMPELKEQAHTMSFDTPKGSDGEEGQAAGDHIAAPERQDQNLDEQQVAKLKQMSTAMSTLMNKLDQNIHSIAESIKPKLKIEDSGKAYAFTLKMFNVDQGTWERMLSDLAKHSKELASDATLNQAKVFNEIHKDFQKFEPYIKKFLKGEGKQSGKGKEDHYHEQMMSGMDDEGKGKYQGQWDAFDAFKKIEKMVDGLDKVVKEDPDQTQKALERVKKTLQDAKQKATTAKKPGVAEIYQLLIDDVSHVHDFSEVHNILKESESAMREKGQQTVGKPYWALDKFMRGKIKPAIDEWNALQAHFEKTGRQLFGLFKRALSKRDF